MVADVVDGNSELFCKLLSQADARASSRVKGERKTIVPSPVYEDEDGEIDVDGPGLSDILLQLSTRPRPRKPPRCCTFHSEVSGFSPSLFRRGPISTNVYCSDFGFEMIVDEVEREVAWFWPWTVEVVRVSSRRDTEEANESEE